MVYALIEISWIKDNNKVVDLLNLSYGVRSHIYDEEAQIPKGCNDILYGNSMMLMTSKHSDWSGTTG